MSKIEKPKRLECVDTLCADCVIVELLQAKSAQIQQALQTAKEFHDLTKELGAEIERLKVQKLTEEEIEAVLRNPNRGLVAKE